MSILKISRLGHPILLQKCEIVKDITGSETKKIIHDMTDTMLDARGIGLAAPQVHINKQILIFRAPEDEQEKDIKITALINPKITKINEKVVNNQDIFNAKRKHDIILMRNLMGIFIFLVFFEARNFM